MCLLLRLLTIIGIIFLIIFLINFFIIAINFFWNQLFAIIGRDGHPFHASGRQHMIASRTGSLGLDCQVFGAGVTIKCLA